MENCPPFFPAKIKVPATGGEKNEESLCSPHWKSNCLGKILQEKIWSKLVEHALLGGAVICTWERWRKAQISSNIFQVFPTDRRTLTSLETGQDIRAWPIPIPPECTLQSEEIPGISIKYQQPTHMAVAGLGYSFP